MLTAIFARIAEHWLFSWLRGPLVELWGLFRYHTKDCLIAALAAASLWLWTSRAHVIAKSHSDLTAMWAASEQNRAATEAQRAIEQAAAKLEAQNADTDYQSSDVPVRDATDRHVADWLRTPPPDVCPSRTVGEAGAPGLRPDVPADPRLAEGAAAMRGFAAASRYAVKLRTWALQVTGYLPAPKAELTPSPTETGGTTDDR